MKRIVILFTLTFLSLCSIFAQIPTLLNQQGLLTDSLGTPLNGVFPMVFNIYTDSTVGTLMFTQSFPGVPVNKGGYSVNLSVSAVNFNQQLWMETQVGTSTLLPRIRLTSAPYSLNSLSLLGPSSLATGTNAIAGGTNNRARGAYSVVSGGGGATAGDSNSVTGSFGVVGGGKSNIASGSSVVAGGQLNQATGNSTTIAGGYNNTAIGSQSAVGGGWLNNATGLQSTIAGGQSNAAIGDKSFIGGGLSNSADGDYSTTAGGAYNHAYGNKSFVGGGEYNKARGNFSSVLGGGSATIADSNSAIGNYSTVTGGSGNVATGDYSFAAGRNAKASDYGSFVWNSASSDFSSTDSSQFLINASGGVGIGTSSPDQILHVRTSSSASSVNNATVEIEAAGTNVDADASILFNLGKTNNLELFPETWSLGVNDSDNQFVLSKRGTLAYDPLWKVDPDGTMRLFNTDGIAAVKFLAEEGTTGAQLELKEKSGGFGIVLDAEEGAADGGADISMYDGTGNVTINFDANFDGSGKGRVTTDELSITGGSDFAEPFELTEETSVEPGTVMSIDVNEEGKLKMSEKAYDKKVAGIISGAGGVNPGITLRQEGILSGNTMVAIAGRVYCKVDASYGAVEPGDLLTTSNTPGHAMKANDPDKSHGTIIGKAMTSMKTGKGLVLVLVNLQ